MNSCRQCGDTFELSDAEESFFAKLSSTVGAQIPIPTLCPLCRMQKRMAFRGELNLFKRASAFSEKEIISFYPKESHCRPYSEKEFWSDDWDPRDYGRDFDFSRSFFEQFADLMRDAPVIALTNKDNNENSAYINCAAACKNCYLLAGANHNEDCYYGNYINRSKSCVDCSFVADSELCYECSDCTGCYNLKYSQNSHNCNDSYFLAHCRGCQDCFGSVGLNNRRYCFFNSQLSKSEYERKLAEIDLESSGVVADLWRMFEEHAASVPRRYMIGEKK